jgi:inosine-uridine nucleoside N-ribohydrolase
MGHPSTGGGIEPKSAFIPPLTGCRQVACWSQGKGNRSNCGIIDVSMSEKGLLALKRFRLLMVFILFVCGVFVTTAFSQGSPQRVIIDTDPGTDDAMAILLALNSPELKVEAFTVVPGNVDVREGLENALKIVSLAGRCDVPVAAGAQHPLNQKLITAQYWHGKNGLADVELPASKCKADPRFGPDLIIQLVHQYPHQITLIPVGPLTNIALAVSKDPTIVPLVKNVVIMGGSINGGNVDGAAEANIYGDPEAAQIVFNAGWMVTMVGSDVGERTLITRKELTQLRSTHGPENDFVSQIVDFYVTRSEKSGWSGAAMYDPLAVAIAMDPTLGTLKEMHVDVETRGEFTRGETVANRTGYNENNVLHGDHYEIDSLLPLQPNARVCLAADRDRFLQLFLSRIQGK